MAGKQKTSTRPPRVGDLVAFDFGGLDVSGTVVEDRGQIGVGGRRLLRVRVEMEPGVDPMFIELPEADLRIVKRVA